MMSQPILDPSRLSTVDFTPPRRPWLDARVEFRKGTFGHAAPRRHLEYLGLPNARDWQPPDADWKLPANWKQIILDGMKDRLERYRSFRLFMDTASGAARARTSATSTWALATRRTRRSLGPSCCARSIGGTSPPPAACSVRLPARAS